MNAIFTVVNNNVTNSLITILSSAKHNDVPHFLFYEEIDDEIIDKYKQVNFVPISSIVEATKYQVFTKYIEQHHHASLFYMVEYLKDYQTVTYLSEHVHVTAEFDYLQFLGEEVFMAPPLAVPFNEEYASNKFIEKYNINTRVYLAEDFVVFNTKQFIEQQIILKFEEFSEELFNQAQNNLNVITRIPSGYVLNLFAANYQHKYLPQNYLLDIKYTAEYHQQMIAFYQPATFDYNLNIDDQLELLKIDVAADTYNLEYLLFTLEFLEDTDLVSKSMLTYNYQILVDLILDRNSKYQMRLGQ